MSEIGTLAAQWLPLLVARAGTATLRAAVRDFKAIETLAKITLTPSPSDCRVVPDLPRVFQLDNDQLKNFLPGTLLLTNGGETRYVPVEDPIREHAGGYQFRVVSARRPGQEGGWSGTVFYSKTVAEKAFQAAILGVGSEPRGKGRLSELVRDDNQGGSILTIDRGSLTCS